MAVRTLYSKARPDPARGRRPTAFNAQAQTTLVHENFALLDNDSIGTKFYFGRVSSSALILATSLIHHTAITSATLNVGFEDPRNVITAQPAVLAAALALASAGTKGLNAAVAVGSLNKPVWELMGLANDPGQEFDLIGTLAAAATAAGNIAVFAHIAREG